MRVGRRVAMSRKMLRRSDHAGVLRAFHKGGDETGHVDWVFAIRSDVDDRVGRVGVDIRYRRIDLLNAHCACFASGELTRAARVIRISGRGYRHVPWEIHSVVKTHSRARL